MAGTGVRKAKSDNLVAKQEDREESRHANDRAEQQDLNQGMDTGDTRFDATWS